MKRGEDRKAALQRLRGARASLRLLHPDPILSSCSINRNTVLTRGQSPESLRLERRRRPANPGVAGILAQEPAARPPKGPCREKELPGEIGRASCRERV